MRTSQWLTFPCPLAVRNSSVILFKDLRRSAVRLSRLRHLDHLKPRPCNLGQFDFQHSLEQIFPYLITPSKATPNVLYKLPKHHLLHCQHTNLLRPLHLWQNPSH
jgi:hypothetical protein